MPFQTKNRLAFLTSLALLFSYIEMILPRPLPFLRFGFGNIALLLSFDLPFTQFCLLVFFKSLASSLVSGTLFSPFFLISLFQSFLSALLMFLIAFLEGKSGKKLFSIFGISVFGSAVSAFAQIFCCSLYLGKGVLSLLGVMLIFNTASGIITAFFATKIKTSMNADLLSQAPVNIMPLENEVSFLPKSGDFPLQFFIALGILCLSASAFFIKNICILVLMLLLSFTGQTLCKRKILILPHIFMWIFILISSIFEPMGRVIFKIWRLSLTSEALLSGLQKSLRLSIAASLSQCAFILKPTENSLLFLILHCYKTMSDKFRSSKGNIFQRIESAIS